MKIKFVPNSYLYKTEIYSWHKQRHSKIWGSRSYRLSTDNCAQYNRCITIPFDLVLRYHLAGKLNHVINLCKDLFRMALSSTNTWFVLYRNTKSWKKKEFQTIISVSYIETPLTVLISCCVRNDNHHFGEFNDCIRTLPIQQHLSNPSWSMAVQCS